MNASQSSDRLSVMSGQRFASAHPLLPGRFSGLLVAMLLLFVVQPFFEGHWLATSLLNIFMSGILLAGVYAVSEKKRNLLVACVLAFPALLGRWVSHFFPHPVIFLASAVLILLVLVVAIQAILRHAVKARRVTADTISAALCAYLLIGLTWAILYTFMEFLHTGSFTLPPRQPSSTAEDWLLYFHFPQFVYYSFVTLTSTGFGDIIPVAGPARSFSMLEAIIGQFYLAVLISRLVGLYIVHSLEEKKSSE